jgi:hypothetical protein
MRKREIEKLLYHAVAEALGVETKSVRRVNTPTPVVAARKARPANRPDNRAAA